MAKIHHALANFFESMAGNTMQKFITCVHNAGGVFYMQKKDIITGGRNKLAIEADGQTIVFYYRNPSDDVYVGQSFYMLGELKNAHLASVENYPQSLAQAQSTKRYKFHLHEAITLSADDLHPNPNMGYPTHTLLFHDPIILASDPKPDLTKTQDRRKYARSVCLWYTRFPLPFKQWYLEQKDHEKEEYIKITDPLGEDVAKIGSPTTYSSATFARIIKELRQRENGVEIGFYWYDLIDGCDGLCTDDYQFFKYHYPERIIGHIYPQSSLETSEINGGFIAHKIRQGHDFGVLGARYCSVTGRHQTVAIIPRKSQVAHELGEYMIENDYVDIEATGIPSTHEEMYNFNPACKEPSKFFLCTTKQYSCKPTTESKSPEWWKAFHHTEYIFHPLPAPLVVAMPNYFVVFEHTDVVPNGKPVSTKTCKIRALPVEELKMLQTALSHENAQAQSNNDAVLAELQAVQSQGVTAEEARIVATQVESIMPDDLEVIADDIMQQQEEKSFGVQSSAPDTTECEQVQQHQAIEPQVDSLAGLKIDISAALRILRCQGFDHDIVKDWICEIYTALADVGIITHEYNPSCFAMRSLNCDISAQAPSLPTTGLDINATKGFGFNIAHIDIDEHKRRYLICIGVDFHFKNMSKDVLEDLLPVEYSAGVDVEYNGVDIVDANNKISAVIDKVTQVFINNRNCAFRKDGRAYGARDEKTFSMEVFGPSRGQMFMVVNVNIQACVETFQRVSIS